MGRRVGFRTHRPAALGNESPLFGGECCSKGGFWESFWIPNLSRSMQISMQKPMPTKHQQMMNKCTNNRCEIEAFTGRLIFRQQRLSIKSCSQIKVRRSESRWRFFQNRCKIDARKSDATMRYKYKKEPKCSQDPSNKQLKWESEKGSQIYPISWVQKARRSVLGAPKGRKGRSAPSAGVRFGA